MDVNALMARIRALMAEVYQRTNPEAAIELADAFEELDQWLSKGGFLPTEWERS